MIFHKNPFEVGPEVVQPGPELVQPGPELVHSNISSTDTIFQTLKYIEF